MPAGPVPRGEAAYKKKDGILTLSSDQTALVWSPLPGTGPPVVSLSVSNITNLQQTPDTAPKVMLKVFEKPRADGGEPVSYLFHFTSPTNARTEANAIKELLSRLLADVRGTDPALPKAAQPEPVNGNGRSASAAMSFASTAIAKPASARWFDDASLQGDTELQQSLMRKDRSLSQIYVDAHASKPDSIPDATFNAQFWSTRINLLRAHAIELNQKKGAYNVLSTVKPRTDNGELKLSISVEQVQMIFQQHPLVKRIYNENVPKLSESEFWSRFFLSRLSKKLRGERVTDIDNTDHLFDRYNEADNSTGFTSRIMAQQVPHIIDLEGNEENQGGFKSGNRKDVEMRPRPNIPIVHTLNSLSEKIMANVAPSDQGPEVSGTLDDETYEELSLRDLRGDVQTNRIILNVQEQNKLFSNQDSAKSEDAKAYEKQVPGDVLFEVQADLETLDDDGAGGIDLHKGIGIDDESDSDEDAPHKMPHVGSRGARREAQGQILEGMKKKRTETYGNEDDETTPMGIPAELTQRCYITNATTTEFLKQFWGVFLSGDAARAQELAYHAESLRRSRERIEALEAEAEEARQKVMEEEKKRIREYFKRTGKKTKWRPEQYKGGKEAVEALFEATLVSLKSALSSYNTAVTAAS